jgi:phosphoglycerate dehydrogenase-like enzyme
MRPEEVDGCDAVGRLRGTKRPDEEPLPDEHPLRKLDNVLLTPHLGYVTVENYRLAYGDAVEDIRVFLAGHPIRTISA